MKKKNFWSRLKEGLRKTSRRFSDGLSGLFLGKRYIDEEILSQLEDLLIESDLGFVFSQNLCEELRNNRYEDLTLEDVSFLLEKKIVEQLASFEKNIFIEPKLPHVILMIGVNGNGKTTTIPKLTRRFLEEGKAVSWVGCDTFRAAAKDQLQIWSKRLNVQLYEGTGDPASLAYDAYKHAAQIKTDVLIIDTAGRLHNNQNLMEELKKIDRVLKKINPEAPHTTILVLDGTVGQNAMEQVRVFSQLFSISGLIMTKLDGTSKGGVLLPIVQTFCLPIFGICIGEDVEDFLDFKASFFTRALLGKE